MNWTIHSDGYWYAFGKTGQRYEVGTLSKGWVLLHICGKRLLEGESIEICKGWAEDHNDAAV